MTEHKLQIPIYCFVMLQAYLYEILSTEKKCEENFKYTKWYLKGNFSEEEIAEIIKFFKDKGLNSDCGILKKLDISELAEGKIKNH